MKTTAIIAKDHADFKEFVKQLDSGGFYIFVNSIDKTRGVEFEDIKITDNAIGYSDLLDACKLRLKKKTFTITEYCVGDFGDLGNKIGTIEAYDKKDAKKKFQERRKISNDEIGFYDFN